ncbi:unnamed protein product [Nippostrongylus brasiliensis]|uniref:Uncharacterized protein n=1 Tax=Nippostrongylus brasiliensis TaxID=27835 RepID=A0A0N4YCL8_NIPBR|nr:unnamed protein product [Nippostrongylus brasiliensis]
MGWVTRADNWRRIAGGGAPAVVVSSAKQLCSSPTKPAGSLSMTKRPLIRLRYQKPTEPEELKRNLETNFRNQREVGHYSMIGSS